ncbi:MAG: hypothetical protein ABI688_00865 [Bacteroidota bacterium]
MKYLFILLLPVLLLTACSIQRRLYSPTQVNNPSLEAKGDYSFSLSYSAPPGFDLNGGYAITNHWALIGGAFSYKNKDQEEDYDLFSTHRDSSSLLYRHKGFHIGTGFYFPLIKNKPSLFLSFFGGFTKGNFEMKEALYQAAPNPAVSPRLNYYKSDIDRWFLQGSLNLYHQNIHQSFITRFNYVGYSNTQTDYDLSQQTEFNLPPQAYPKWSSFLDFSSDTKIFFSKKQALGLQLFMTTTTRLNREDFNFYFYPTRIGVGIVFKSPFAPK